MISTEVFRNNVTVKHFSQSPVEEEKIKSLTSVIKNCPSVDNRQPFKVIFVRDEQIKRNISVALSNNKSFLEAPLVIVVCSLPDDAYPTLGGFLNSYPVDAGILIERLTLAARNLGLQTEWHYVFREERIREIVKGPEESRVISISPLGFANEVAALPPSKQLQELVSYDHF